MKKLLFFAFAAVAVVGCQPQPVVVQPPAQQPPAVQNNFYPQQRPQPASPPVIVVPSRPAPPPVIVVPAQPAHCPHCKQPCGPGHRCPPGTHIGVGPGGVDINIRK